MVKQDNRPIVFWIDLRRSDVSPKRSSNEEMRRTGMAEIGAALIVGDEMGWYPPAEGVFERDSRRDGRL